MEKIDEVRYIIVHHTERNNDFPEFIRWRHKHLRGWEDIGYHYLIGNPRPFSIDGKIYTGRSEKLEGAHALGYNKNSLGVCLIGNFDKNFPSKKQFASLFSILEEKMEEYNIPLENIRGHRELCGIKNLVQGILLI